MPYNKASLDEVMFMEGLKIYPIIADYAVAGENANGTIKRKLNIKVSDDSIERLSASVDYIHTSFTPFVTSNNERYFRDGNDIIGIMLKPKTKNEYLLITSRIRCSQLKVDEVKAIDLIHAAFSEAQKKFN
jgi:hypothetical protein